MVESDLFVFAMFSPPGREHTFIIKASMYRHCYNRQSGLAQLEDTQIEHCSRLNGRHAKTIQYGFVDLWTVCSQGLSYVQLQFGARLAFRYPGRLPSGSTPVVADNLSYHLVWICFPGV